MALPTFNAFSLQDDNFITERVTFRPFAQRAVVRAKVNRREGIKLLATEFGEKEITIEGKLFADTSTELQTLIDNLKKNLQVEEGDLIIEQNRTYRATVTQLVIPDEHYNQTRAPYEITFVTSDPFSEGSQLTVIIPVQSGSFTVSGYVMISGSFFSRPVITYTPPSATGDTYIGRFDLYHVGTGQTVTVSGLGSGQIQGMSYQDELVVNLDDFTVLEGTAEVDSSGSFPKFDPGDNNYTLTASGRAFPGGTVTVVYSPRYL